MRKNTSGAGRALRSLASAMVRWRDVAISLQRLSQQQLDSLVAGDSKSFGQILWQKQIAQREFRRATMQVRSLRKRTQIRDWTVEQGGLVGGLIPDLWQIEGEVAGLLRDAAEYEIRCGEILRRRMREIHHARAA